jgi:hypothetical protein
MYVLQCVRVYVAQCYTSVFSFIKLIRFWNLFFQYNKLRVLPFESFFFAIWHLRGSF